MIMRDDALIPPNFRLERLRLYGAGEAPPLRAIQAPVVAEERDDEDDAPEIEEAEDVSAEAADEEQGGEDERGRRRRPRRRRRTKEARETRPAAAAAAAEAPIVSEAAEPSAAEREAEAERRRRRRGRRGGRARGRREEGAEGQTSGLAVAAETIEIVTLAEDERIHRETEAQPDLEIWVGEAGVETASLAPLAGDGAPPVHPEPEAQQPEPMPTAEAEAGIPFAGEVERVLEAATAETAPMGHGEPFVDAEPVAAATAHPGEEVRTITDKPANPRRGWWQRLMQS
jgi:ribonuclease E